MRVSRFPLVFSFLLILALMAKAASSPQFAQRLTAGQVFYNQGKIEQAIKEFRAAVELEPGNSMAHLWLARSLGRKAENANPIRAAFLVGDVRREFERAVELDPNNLEARSDLMEFYLEAPGAFGGGADKAREQAAAMAQLDPAEGHWARAKIAEKEKQYELAEREYRAAAEANPQRAGYRRDLDAFLKKHPAGKRRAGAP